MTKSTAEHPVVSADPLPAELPLVTVIIPSYNEASTIDELLRRVVAVPLAKQIVVVDDGSTDDTRNLLLKWEDRGDAEVYFHHKNQGKSSAIRTGLEHAQGRFTIIQDADLEYDPGDYSALLEPLTSGRATVVYGSRYLTREHRRRQPWRLFRFGVSAVNLCARALYGIKLTDEATCYKAFPTSLLRAMNLQSERFEFCPEVTAKTCRLGLAIHEVPISYYPRNHQDGKKIRFTDGIEAVGTLWKWRKWQGVWPERASAETQPKTGHVHPG